MKGVGNQQDYGMRIYDNRLGRFLSTDPLTSKYAFYSTYQFAGNKPIVAIDMDGGEDRWVHQIILYNGTTVETQDGTDQINDITKAQNAAMFNMPQLKEGGVLYTVQDLREPNAETKVVAYTPEVTVSPTLLDKFVDNVVKKPLGPVKEVMNAMDYMGAKMTGSMENYGVDEGEQGRKKWVNRGHNAATAMKSAGKIWKPLAVPGEVLDKIVSFSELCTDIEKGNYTTAVVRVTGEGAAEMIGQSLKAAGLGESGKVGKVLEGTVNVGATVAKKEAIKAAEKADESKK